MSDRAVSRDAPRQLPQNFLSALRAGSVRDAWLMGLFGVLMLLAGGAQADLIVDGLTQTPANVVGVGEPVSYDLTVSTNSTSGNEFVAVDVLDASGASVPPSQMQSSGCNWDGLWFCSFVSPGQPVTYQFTWTPAAGTRDLTFDVQCSSNCAGDAARIRTVVGDPPLAANDNAEAESSVTVLVPVLGNDRDPQQLPLTLDGVISPSNGTAVVVAGGINYTSVAGFTGVDNFVYQISNSNGSTATATVTVTVYESLTTVARDDQVESAQDSTVVMDVLANDVGARGLTISVQSTTTPAQGVVVINNDGTLSYTPTAGFVGSDSFQYTMADSAGQTGTATVNMAVFSTATAADDSVDAKSGETIVINVLANDSGSNGSGVSLKAVGAAQNGRVDFDLELGVISYSPNPGFEGQDQFVYTLIDTNEQEATGTVRVTVSLAQEVPAPTAVTPTNLAGLAGLTENQRAYATVMDQACATVASGDLSTHCAAIAGMSNSNQVNALNQMVPEQLHSMGTESMEATATQLTNVKARVLELRGGGLGPMSLSQLRLAINGSSLPFGTLLQAAGNRNRANDDADAALAPSPRFGMFVNGRINLGDKETTRRETGFDFSVQGLTVGMDYRFSDRLFLGGALGYSSGEADFDRNVGELDTQATSFSVYGSYFQSERFYMDWILNVAASDYELDRRIVFAGVDTVASGAPDGTQYGLALNFGSDYLWGGVMISPYARVEYIDAEVDAYTETGGSGFALAVDEQAIESLTTALALRVSKTYSMRWGVLVPAAHAEWEHEFKDNSRAINARFADAPGAGTFTITTDDPDRDYFNVGANVSAVMERGRAVFISYEALLGQSHVTNSTIELGYRMEF